MDRGGRWRAGGRVWTRRVGTSRCVPVVRFSSSDRCDAGGGNHEYLDYDEHDHNDRAHNDDHARTHTRGGRVRTSCSDLCADTDQ